MKENFLPAFRGINESEYHALCAFGFIRKKTFEKGETIFSTGSHVTELGLLCSGCVHIENNDLWGNKSILSVVEPGQVFAETYALCHEALMVDAVAAEETSVVFLNLQRALDDSQAGQSWYPKLQKNLLLMSARKKYDPFGANLLHDTQNNTRPSFNLSFRAGGKKRRQCV